ncbi:YTH domain-containing protein ECT3-like isoform X2 [Pistacia vera]|uniref:YTH domain-containing protein ECT3-like isoform X2 n=1 Tax=Pistacia vera TaxID=55513 RepID=UPI0012630167|nr:YTH domain-containing protein ECT3-like isoform X2 [Pistacia vera]
MAGEKNIEKDQPLATELKSDPISKSAERDVTSGNNGIRSDLTTTMASLGDTPSSMKGETNQESVGEHGARSQPTVFDNYLYPAYNGPFTQVDNNGYFHTDPSHSGMQSDNGSLIYYLPGYDPYGTGAIVGVDGQCVGQQPYFSSSGYLQHPVSYGAEAMPCYTWDSTYVGDAQNGNSAGSGNAKYGSSTAYGKSNSLNYMKTNGNVTNKFSKCSYAQPTKPLTKVPQLGSDFAAGLLKGYPSTGKYSSFANQKQGLYPPNSQVNYKTNGRLWNGNDRYKSRDRFSRNGDLESAVELTRGPRAHNKSAPLDFSVKKEELGVAVCRDQYNLPDFQTEYEKAKFYVIKSYNEDDIHKCIKYDVWASTPNGNKKLDAAFREVEPKTSKTGAKCPIFLFFSVNGSGQFVGLAEMIGQVDFNKDMDFWQLDKWNGFFPVKWHVVKDVPNAQLRHIILENNENKPVTHSRDTQEIGLQQGLEMLKIFKGCSAKTSLLDDFNFYETREKSQNVKKSTKPATQRIKDDGFPKHVKAGDRNFEESLINLTKSLSLIASPTQEMGTVMKSIENSVPSVAAAP